MKTIKGYHLLPVNPLISVTEFEDFITNNSSFYNVQYEDIVEPEQLQTSKGTEITNVQYL